MEKNTAIIGVLLLLIGTGIGYTLTSSAPTQWGHMMADGTMMGQRIDQHFIVQMIPHHEGAIEMAEIALTRSKRPEIISLANDIVEAQTREITDMTTWYTSWFGSTPPEGGAGMGQGGMTGDIGDLSSASDAEFDRVFLTQMIPHHEMAIMMASMLAATTERSEMKQLADDISTSQAREIAMMRSWLEQWY
ncbi:MAG: DUF305 domain-containing protein [Minisyncoccia bacterium]